MIKAIIFSLVAGIGGLFIATKFIPGVTFQGSWTALLIIGGILGIVIAVIKPLLGLVSFLLKILLLAISSGIILWVLKTIFPALVIAGFIPLVYASALVALLVIILSIIY